MKIETGDKSGIRSLTVLGQIASLQDVTEFKQVLARACSQGSVNIYFEESIVLPSSIIGALLQKKEIDKVELKIFVRRKELLESLQKLRLSDMLGLAYY
jgi:hypothetical protein